MSRRSSTGSRSSTNSRSRSSKARRSRARSEPQANEGSSKARRSRARTLHLDAFSGMAGNMFLGALLDLGLSRRALADGLAGLGVEYTLRVSKVRRGALAARFVSVGIPKSRTANISRRTGSHSHGGRHYRDVVKVLTRARLAGPVRDRALAIFEAIGRAEARVHGVDLERVHFHEVGAVDALVDVVGAAIGLEQLGVGRVTCTPVALGHGAIETDHGRLPLPAPATLELLRGIPTVPLNVEWETVTPTGAAILATLVDEFRSMPALTIRAIGHGAGNDRPGPLPNVVRAILGEGGDLGWDRIVGLEANLDDLVPEHFDYLMERLYETGALDVSIQTIQMKKNRPGFLLRVLAQPADRVPLAEVLFTESTTLGVRTLDFDRVLLPRHTRRVVTPFGAIQVKVVRRGDSEEVSAEYDDCKRAARKARVPLRNVVQSAEDAARRG